MVARFDDKGRIIWYRHILPGVLYNAIQDADGNIITVGIAGINKMPGDTEPGDETVIRYNADPTADMNALDCSNYSEHFGQMGYLVKLAPDGTILWCTLFTADQELADGWYGGSNLNDVVAVTENGQQVYYAVGRSDKGQAGAQPYIVRVNSDGQRVDDLWCEDDDATFPMDWPTYPGGWFFSLAKDPQSDRLVASGFIDSPFGPQAILYAFDAPQPDLAPEWFHATSEASDAVVLQGGNYPTLFNFSTGGAFIKRDTETLVAWPVMSNYIIPDINAGRKAAFLKVHAFTYAGAYQWTSDLGKIAAYDLQADLVPTADGDLAVVSSKWSNVEEPVFEFPENPFRWLDLPQSTRDWIIADFSEDVDPGMPGTQQVDWPGTDVFDYWNTDPFVAKLSAQDGSMLWCTQWDADPTGEFECWPGDIRNQECMYKITETPDGGLVLSGNTSHNFDDYYLTKLGSDCQSRVEYDQTITAGLVNNVYTVGVNEEWLTDKTVRGLISIPNGASLTISGGATIRFADSRQLLDRTQILVEVGGRLIVNGDATLTSIATCPGSMWDGIVVKGSNEGQGADYAYQGYARLRNATIENARTALATNGQFVAGENIAGYQMQFAGGGVILADQVTFKNCQRNVVMGMYENHEIGDPQAILANKTRFNRCAFKTTGPLADPRLAPLDAVFLLGVRGINFSGCNFHSDGPFPIVTDNGAFASDYKSGTGIKSINSTFTVGPYCAAYDQNGNCVPTSITRGRFFGLTRGIFASTFDLSRTFSVDQTDFDKNHFGIRMEGTNDPAITRSTFTVREPFVGDLEDKPYGMYSDQCTGYRIEENTFKRDVMATVPMVGLVIKDSGEEYNTFYNNSFDNFDRGNSVAALIEGKNASADEIIGLEVKCNDFGLEADNSFDVAMTGEEVRVQATQGSDIFDQTDPAQLKNPAGNRFSLDHIGVFDIEEDWTVASELPSVISYFHHEPVAGSRTKPEYKDGQFETQSVTAFWPGKPQACPSNFIIVRGREEERQFAMQEDGELNESKQAYDATKDDGDTYTLLSFVSDPVHSSAQVRDALVSVAPAASAEAFQAAFERQPAMNAWHLTQALVSYSPLQTEVLRMVEESGLPTFYTGIVASAQNGETNILTLLQSAIARDASEKAVALTGLARSSWLDSLGLGDVLDSLMMFHESLPSDNSDRTIAGVLAASGDFEALDELATLTIGSSPVPQLFEVQKRYAIAQGAGGWQAIGTADRDWLANTAAQRNVIGSAHAAAWLQALGNEPLDEVILLPEEDRSMVSRDQSFGRVAWEPGIFLDAYPNPASEIVYLNYAIPDDLSGAVVRVSDASGRLIATQSTATGTGIAQIAVGNVEPGLYIVELVSEQVRLAQTKFSVIHAAP